MSFYDYQISQTISDQQYPFYALIMAAMCQANTGNLARLCKVFPDIYDELIERYKAPGDMLPEER